MKKITLYSLIISLFISSLSFAQTINQNIVNKKINALNLHRTKYNLPPFTVAIETLSSASYEAQKPAGALPFDCGYVNANGKVFVSAPTTTEQLNVFSNINQAALYYVCQSFLQYYYQTSEMPLWFKTGFAAYEADIRFDDNDIKTAFNNYGGTLTSFDILNDPTTFSANNGLAVSYMFGEYMGVYNIWSYHMIQEVNASTIIPASWWWNIESLDKLFTIWSRYFNARILEENEQNRIKLGQETAHFKFYYRASENYWAFDFPTILEEAITEYMGLLNFEVYEKFSYITMPECNFALIDGVECISRYTGGTAWSSGLSSTSPNNANDNNIFRGLIRHELGHLTGLQLPNGAITSWLNEGFASFMEGSPLTPEEIIRLQAATEKALNDATSYFGHLPSFEETKIYPGSSYDYYLLGVIIQNFIYEDGGYEAVKDIMIDPETGITNLGYSSLEAFMTAYYFYLNVRMLKKKVAILNTSFQDGTVYSSSLDLNWTPLDPVVPLNISYSVDNGNQWTNIKTNTTLTNSTLEFSTDFYGEFYIKFNSPSVLNFETIYGPYQRLNADILNLLSPNGSELLISGDTAKIKWGFTNISTINIEYSIDNGSNWIGIATNVATSSNNYDWIIQNISSNQCLIKISDVSNPAVYDICDNVFRIMLSNNAGGPYNADNNTVLLMHFNGDLTNNSTLSSDGVPHGSETSYSNNTLSNLGQSLNLDGSSYVTVTHNTDLNLNGDWTIELWFRPTEFSTYQYFVQKPGDTDSYFSNYSLELQSGWGNVLHGFYFSNEQARINVVEMSPTLNKWYHVAFIRDISNSKISIIVHDENWNEVSSSSQNYSGNDNNVQLNTKNLRIGEGFIGDINELRISNIVRSFDVLGIKENVFKDKYKMYPNPTKNNLNINLPKKVDVSIYTITGQKVLEKKNIKEGVIDISKLKSGLYIVLFKGEKGTFSKKLIIE